MNKNTPKGDLVLYQTEDGLAEINLRAIKGKVWLRQANIADLLASTTQNMTLHIKSIYEDAEPESMSTCKDFLQVRTENERELLTHTGKMQMAVAQKLAAERYEVFDSKSKKVKALAADEEGIKVLEYFAKKLEQKGGGEDGHS